MDLKRSLEAEVEVDVAKRLRLASGELTDRSLKFYF